MTPFQNLLSKNKETCLGLVDLRQPTITLKDVIVTPAIKSALETIVCEFKNREVLQRYNLPVANKILFVGPPGVGKTWAAMGLAGELGMDVCYARWDAIIDSYLGKTGNNIRSVFEAAAKQPIVLFLDEFDAVGKERGGGSHQEVGEMQRVVVSLLQNIDLFFDQSILIAASNRGDILDTAIWRRFAVVNIELPKAEERKALIKYCAKGLPIDLDIDEWVAITQGKSGAVIRDMVMAEAKKAVLAGLANETTKRE